ncbi:MAPEG family protein [Bacteriovorax sp. PP10]|uniref:MAPEG family protein n=1 Tax=Bacteriovorax antarcticus TaxID=3088717 RepID=A0ABU5VX83_9BACT|nr:MAPEG family protein [Bacteriovorax sp. PP10]MEA9357671.1 MAPEG family protein [Bacteriovorax sp. PP10]
MVLSIELKMLFYSAILGIVQLLIATQLSTAQRGIKWNLSPRDEKAPELTGVAGRMDRAFKNFMETFPFFIVAIVIVQITQMQSSSSSIGAMLYFWARLLYVPLYAAGIPGVRTFVWVISFVGIIMVLSALF